MTTTLTRPANGARPASDETTDMVPARPAPLAIVPQAASLVPQTVEEAVRYAQLFARSGMFAAKTQEAAFTILLTGMELGLGPAQAMRAFHVIEGKPSPSADALVALCLRHKDVCKYFVPVSVTEKEATFETSRVGAPQPFKTTYTIADAGKAGLLNKKNWRENPAAMLAARCKAKLVRMVYPDLTLGLYTPEELGDKGYMATEAAEIPAEALSPEEAYEQEAASLRAAIKAVMQGAKADADLFKRLGAEKTRLYGSESLTTLGNADLVILLEALGDIAAPVDMSAEAEEADGQAAKAEKVAESESAAAALTEADMEAELAEKGDPFA